MSAYDPLASDTSAFAAASAWGGASPTPSRSPSPETPRRSSTLPPAPQTPDKTPQIYGAPDPGLIAPSNSAVNGERLERSDQYLRVRITGLDRNRKDILIRLDAQVSPAAPFLLLLDQYLCLVDKPPELQRPDVSEHFSVICGVPAIRRADHLQQSADYHSCTTPRPNLCAYRRRRSAYILSFEDSLTESHSDDRLVKLMLQRWITRICEDSVILQDEELRSFIESDFGVRIYTSSCPPAPTDTFHQYQPTIRAKRKTTTGLSILRRSVPDEDKDLVTARLDLTKLEMQFSDAAKAIDKLSKAKKGAASTLR